MQTFIVEAIISGEKTTREYQANKRYEVQPRFQKDYPMARFLGAIEKEVWEAAQDHMIRTNRTEEHRHENLRGGN